MRSSVGTVIYAVVGVLVAGAHHYFSHTSALRPILSAILAISLWPLVLLGINLHVK